MSSNATSRGLGWRIGWTVAGFVPFIAVSAVQLASKFGSDEKLDKASKAAAMPSLAFGVGVAMLLAHRRPDPHIAVLLLAGIGLSWLGDILLDRLALGLGMFFAAHAAYIWMFERAFPSRPPSRWGAIAIPWFLALLWVLIPRAVGMAPLIACYGVILATMAISGSRGNVFTTLGGLLFVLSDTVLALRLFTRLLPGTLSKFTVMLSYLAAQALIATGILHDANRTTIFRPDVFVSRSAT